MDFAGDFFGKKETGVADIPKKEMVVLFEHGAGARNDEEIGLSGYVIKPKPRILLDRREKLPEEGRIRLHFTRIRSEANARNRSPMKG